MCGIAGIVDQRMAIDKLASQAVEMRTRLAHRGPDDAGLHVDRNSGVALVHTRLSIIDLSKASHQPMTSPDGRYTIVFNGEIYNYRSLREELSSAGTDFHSSGDTEVVLALYARVGPGCLDRLRGMFALAIWDAREKTMFLARDPLGIKPMYIHSEDSGRLVFSSELRALRSVMEGIPRLDPQGLASYLQFGHVVEPRTLLRHVRLLPAGTWARWKDRQLASPHRYWSLPSGEGAGGVGTIRETLISSVRAHFVSDVPVGLFLSGGLDSTAVLALAASEFGEGLRTFSIGFTEQDWNEAPLASRVAKHFRADHTEHIMTAKEGLSLFRTFLQSIDQPSIDGFNTWCVARLARLKGMKVVLSGLGGDEMFGGYPSFRDVLKMRRVHRALQFMGGPLAGRLLERKASDARLRRMGDYLSSHGALLEAWRCYRGLFTRRETSLLCLALAGRNARRRISTAGMALDQADPRLAISSLEGGVYMRNQLLRDSDVMSMAHALELRVPLADRMVWESVASISPDLRFAAGKGLLRRSVPEIPGFVAHAPKKGFRFPFPEWIRREWDNIFDPVRLRFGGLVPLDSWSRLFSLYVLDDWMTRLGVEK